jgi:hypothetical protein
MIEKTFVPFHEIKDQEVIIVDGLHPRGLILSHWKAGNIHSEITDDTSGGIVLNAIEKNFSGIGNPLISATHFDIDGFVGVWALFEPELAMQYKSVLHQMAVIGDFRELNLNNDGADHALKLVCYINAVEKEKFYVPFGEADEIKLCVEKFEYFIPTFKEVLLNTDQFQATWQEEYNHALAGYNRIDSGEYPINNYPEIGLQCIHAKAPMHYYGLFSKSDGFDIVMSIYPENKYEVEYKYTTWVDITSRPTLPRISFKPLLQQLNILEQNQYTWHSDGVSDTGPILRLEKDNLSKAERYANPTEREIYPSSIDSYIFERLITDFFQFAYRNISPKKNWTWKEVRSIQLM